jgi:hypothetical protein
MRILIDRLFSSVNRPGPLYTGHAGLGVYDQNMESKPIRTNPFTSVTSIKLYLTYHICLLICTNT